MRRKTIKMRVILYFIQFMVTQKVAPEIHCDPFTECSSRLPQGSAHGHGLKGTLLKITMLQHSSVFVIAIRDEYWEGTHMLFNMNNEKAWSWAHTQFIKRCPRSFTCLSTEHWVQGMLWLYVTCDRQATEFLLMKVNFENSSAIHLGIAPRNFSDAGRDHT